MMNHFIFYLTEYPTTKPNDSLKVVYLEYKDHWDVYGCMSDREILLPLNIQYHLNIRGEIAHHAFEITDPDITEEDFIKAGFVKDQSFVDFVKIYENVK